MFFRCWMLLLLLCSAAFSQDAQPAVWNKRVLSGREWKIARWFAVSFVGAQRLRCGEKISADRLFAWRGRARHR